MSRADDELGDAGEAEMAAAADGHDGDGTPAASRANAPPAAMSLPAERARPLTRGVGVLVGVVTFGFVGFVDGVVALARAPRGSLGKHGAWVFVLFHSVAVLMTLGIALGAAEEAFLESARRVPTFVRVSAWVLDGPRRWFARDEALALRTLLGIAAFVMLVGPVFPVAYFTATRFHSELLASTATTLVVIADAAFAAIFVAAVTAPAGGIIRRMGPLGSPGAVMLLASLAVLVPVARFIRRHWATFQNLDLGLGAIVAALLVGNLVALLVVGARISRAGQPLRSRTVFGATGLALAAFGVSAVTFGSRQTVASVIFNRSVVTHYVVRGLQAAIDFDRDGYSPAFGGGDCDDSNPNIHPGAPDIPDNGIDENCSGHDAHPVSDETDGKMTALPPELAGKRPSVVFIIVDAMRPDHLGCYGYARPTSPNIDAFAQGAARFTNAFAVAPRTLLSLSAVWVGRYPSLIAWGHDARYPALEDENVTLAEELTALGYHTAAFNNFSFFSHATGFFQGFVEVHEGRNFADESGPAIDQFQAFLDAQAKGDTPFFAWLHLLEAHAPYVRRTTPRDFGDAAIDRYDEGIARADELLGPVFAKLAQLGAKRPLVTFMAADHGEAFGEHGAYYHGYDLHDEALRIPLLVSGPGIPPGVRAPLTALFDLNPTILNLAGGKVAVPVSARSIVPVLTDATPHPIVFPGWREYLYAEATPDGFIPAEQKVLNAPPYKILNDLRAGTWELFDIEHDPSESVNLFDDRPELASKMREQLLNWSDGGALATNRSSEIIAAARLPAEPVMQHPLHVKFGDVMELLGFDLPETRIPIRGTIRATLYYRVISRTRQPVWIDLHFEPWDGRGGTDLDARHYPLFSRYSTTQWNPGEILRDEVALRVEPDIRATKMRMDLLLEKEPSLTRVPPERDVTAQKGLLLGEIEIVPAK